MKQLILLSIFTFFTIGTLESQTQISLGYGMHRDAGYSGLGQRVRNAYRDISPVKTPRFHNFFKSRGIVSLGLKKKMKRHHLGLNLSYEHQINTQMIIVTNLDLPSEFDFVSDTKMHVLHLGIEYHFEWLKLENFSAYSGVSAYTGLNKYRARYFNVDRYQDNYDSAGFPDLVNFGAIRGTALLFDGQLTPIGLKYGKDKGLFLEYGIGVRGQFHGGLFTTLSGNDEEEDPRKRRKIIQP